MAEFCREYDGRGSQVVLPHSARRVNYTRCLVPVVCHLSHATKLPRSEMFLPDPANTRTGLSPTSGRVHFYRVMTHRKLPPLTVLSTFTGAGGLDLGLECAGFKTVACIEFDERARDTIVANRPHWNLLETGDILQAAYELTPEEVGLKLGELSLLAGGPPCQPYSAAAQWAERGRAGLDDPRSLCLLAFLHLAETFLPHVILIENVPGFVSGRSSALDVINDELARINSVCGSSYKADVQILRAEQFGVAQCRRRAIIVARRDGQCFTWPEPTHLDSPIRAGDALAGVRPERLPQPKGQWAELLPTIPAGMNYRYHTARGDGQPLFGHRRWFWSFLLKLAPDQPSWTIPAQAGPATGPFHWESRPFAVEELARLQSFPTTWVFEGGEGAKRKQIGNATPPLLAEVVGRAIAESVFGRRFGSDLRLAIRRQRTVPVPPEVTSVPLRFLERINGQGDHPGVGRGPGAARKQSRVLLEQLALVMELHRERAAQLESAGRLTQVTSDQDASSLAKTPIAPLPVPTTPADAILHRQPPPDHVERPSPKGGSRSSRAA